MRVRFVCLGDPEPPCVSRHFVPHRWRELPGCVLCKPLEQRDLVLPVRGDGAWLRLLPGAAFGDVFARALAAAAHVDVRAARGERRHCRAAPHRADWRRLRRVRPVLLALLHSRTDLRIWYALFSCSIVDSYSRACRRNCIRDEGSRTMATRSI